MSNIKANKSNKTFNFSKNFFKSLIAPIVAVILAVVFAFTFGFNKSMDYNGGIVASIVFGVDVNLEDSNTYNLYKQNVDGILETHGISGDVYSVEVNDKQEYTLVVKFAYNGSEEDQKELITNLKADLKQEFYSEMSDDDLKKNNYVLVEAFGSVVDNNLVLYTALSTLVCALVMCVYIALRNGINAGVLSFLLAILSNVLTISLIMVTRVPLTYATIAVVPFVTIISVIASIVYIKKAKNLLANSQSYDKKDNHVLANDTANESLRSQVILASVVAVALVCIGLTNIFNSVLYLSISFLVAVASVLYTTVLLLPWLFAKTFVRKVKKTKTTKETNKTERKLTEDEVMQETDLDNLVSN